MSDKPLRNEADWILPHVAFEQGLKFCRPCFLEWSGPDQPDGSIPRWAFHNCRGELCHMHQAIKAFRQSIRRAGRAFPGWALNFHMEMERVYRKAAKDFNEVDHIVPLKHPLVSGLHVPWNLQILTPTENAAKGNSFRMEM